MFKLSKLGAKPGARTTTDERVYVPDYGHLLPPEIREFTGAVKLDARGEHPSVQHGGGHGGSHPHLIHEFLRSIVEHRAPAIDEIKAADWTAPGNLRACLGHAGRCDRGGAGLCEVLL